MDACKPTVLPLRAGGGVGGVMRIAWTSAMEDELRRLYPTQSAQECADAIGVGLSSVVNRVTLLGLSKSPEWIAARTRQRWAEGRHDASRSAHFQKGLQSWNKGLRGVVGVQEGCRRTQFKPGELTGAARHNYVPVGTEKIRDGLLCRKMTDDQSIYPAARWQPVQRLVWEAAHGPIPPGHIVVFKPGRHTTERDLITLDRLELVSRAENMRRNSYHTRYPKEVAQLIQLKGALNRKINRRQKEAQP